MSRQNKYLYLYRLSLMVIVWLLLYFVYPAYAMEYFEGYYMYLGRDPDQQQEQYSPELNGITHDDSNWYFSQEMRLWKMPVELDLGNSTQMTCNNAYGVVCRNIYDDFTSWSNYPYNHIGDITYFRYDDGSVEKGLLFVPLEKSLPPPDDPACIDIPELCEPLVPAIAVYDPDTLTLIAYAEVPGFPDSSNAPWVAVGPDGNLYIIGKHEKGLLQVFAVDYDKLVKPVFPLWSVLILNPLPDSFIHLVDEYGDVLNIDGQGGVITDSGKLLYLVSGGASAYNPITDGINVFDIVTGQRIRQSSRSGSDVFHFNYDPGGTTQEEPEGLTIWDLEGTNSPHRGQLHVILLDNDWPDDDDIFLLHYTNRIYVDSSYTGAEETGHPDTPIKTVTGAVFIAWDGSVVTMQDGSYPETLTISKTWPILLDSQGGSAIIGQ
jgi:hypothetical protein